MSGSLNGNQTKGEKENGPFLKSHLMCLIDVSVVAFSSSVYFLTTSRQKLEGMEIKAPFLKSQFYALGN